MKLVAPNSPNDKVKAKMLLTSGFQNDGLNQPPTRPAERRPAHQPHAANSAGCCFAGTMVRMTKGSAIRLWLIGTNSGKLITSSGGRLKNRMNPSPASPPRCPSAA